MGLKKSSTWLAIERAFDKYQKESEMLEAEHGYKSPPVRTVKVRTTRRAEKLIDALLRSEAQSTG